MDHVNLYLFSSSLNRSYFVSQGLQDDTIKAFAVSDDCSLWFSSFKESTSKKLIWRLYLYPCSFNINTLIKINDSKISEHFCGNDQSSFLEKSLKMSLCLTGSNQLVVKPFSDFTSVNVGVWSSRVFEIL